MSDAVAVRCAPAAARASSVRIENRSDRAVHVLDGDRMPYLIADDGGLLVLYGVTPPDPEVDYYGVEIPTTRPLEPGAAIEHEVGLSPLYLSDHYETRREPTAHDRHRRPCAARSAGATRRSSGRSAICSRSSPCSPGSSGRPRSRSRSSS